NMNRQHGFTLLELMVTVAVAAIIVSIAVPSFSAMLNRHRLEAAASELKFNLLLARSQAIKQNRDVAVSFRTGADASAWAYGLSDTGGCDPTETDKAADDACTVDGALKAFRGDSWRGVELTSA